MPKFKKILVANRGEIAVRIMRAANEMGKVTVSVFAEEDKLSLHRFKSDEAYRIGRGLGPVEAYLSIEEIMRVARHSGADAIHPGYGLLSENPELSDACSRAGITFIGPDSETMRLLGDKSSARKVAVEAGVPVIPATDLLPEDINAVRQMADVLGYPLMLKAAWGGGGRGMRRIASPNDIETAIKEGRSEARAAFGNDACFLEKLITNAKHVEVQILGDSSGNVFHLFERDCSIQRRNQKIVERAPAPFLTENQRRTVCEFGIKIAKHTGYRNAGTVEFLLDAETGSFHFIEVNPRIQVEHTVTEEVTGIDIVRAQILIAEGATLEDATGFASQDAISLKGHAIQTRITTEDPLNNFIPDYGRIVAYRSATGMGIRLDEGTAYSGGVITRYYDSLLVKVTAWAPTPGDAIKRMGRALREFRIRGVATNIAFVENLLNHPAFLSDEYSTTFIDRTPDLFTFRKRRDRATRILRYIADVTVNGNPETAGRNTARTPLKTPVPPPLSEERSELGPKQILTERGPKGLADWILDQDQLFVTDTTMRDAHQSLLATRMRSFDIIGAADAYSSNLPALFSLECWGGASFDVAYRFLKECPWQRLRDIRSRAPNIMTQMLLRASNGVGYSNYPDNVIQFFVSQAATSGIDVFRVFDSLNWVENMRVAMDAVIASGKVCEAAICYTGDISNPERSKYDLNYYVSLAAELKEAGAHFLSIKDMSGVLKPSAASVLVRALKEEVGLPIHLHTHDTSGMGIATALAAADAGADVIDAAIDSFSGGTSQPCMGSIVEALRGSNRDTGLDVSAIRGLSEYWADVRDLYAAFDEGLPAPASEIFLHEMPGGQFSNLKAQARSLGLQDRWPEIAVAYAEANLMFGDIVKVTPTSKVVGDMALMMVSQGVSRKEIEDPNIEVAFPSSVVDLMRGNIGQPVGGFPEGLRKKVLKGETPIDVRPGELLEPIDIEATRRSLSDQLNGFEVDDEDLAGYLMYPSVFLDYMGHHQKFGPVRTLPTRVFLYGMKPQEVISVDIDPGKTLEIQLQAVGATGDDGHARVFFELNGQPRTIRIADRAAVAMAPQPLIAESGNPLHVGAPMPGTVASISVQQGQHVGKGEILLTIEAMKMEVGVYSELGGEVAEIHVKPGQPFEAKQLLIEINPETNPADAH